jgi:hypothetical protein
VEEKRIGMAWGDEEDEWMVSVEGKPRIGVSDARLGEEGEAFGMVMMSSHRE